MMLLVFLFASSLFRGLASLLLLLSVFTKPSLALFLGQDPGWLHTNSDASHVPAKLTILPGLQVDLASLGPPADVSRRSLVLDRTSEKSSATEAGHRAVVDMLGSRFVANLAFIRR